MKNENAEQPAQQEPVATVTSETGADISMSWWHEPALPVGTTLYTTPAQRKPWVGLTDEEIYSVLENLQVMYNRPPTTDSRIIFARVIEAKLKEKNT